MQMSFSKSIVFTACSFLILASCASIASAQESDSDRMVEAVMSGNAKQIDALKKKGVSLDAVSSDGETALMKLAGDGRTADVKKAITLGAKANAKNNDGETALFSAASSGHADLAIYLISKGAKADQVSSLKECALHAAARAESMKLAKKLKELAPSCLKQKNDEGRTPAQIATDLGNTELAKLLKP
jgi:ankyrin repeat protein